MNKYLQMENDWGFADLGQFAQKRVMKGSMMVGANYDIEEVVKDVGVHLSTNIKAYLTYKKVQLMRTESLQILVGLQDVSSEDAVVPVANNVIERIDRELHEGVDPVEPLRWAMEPGRAIVMP